MTAIGTQTPRAAWKTVPIVATCFVLFAAVILWQWNQLRVEDAAKTSFVVEGSEAPAASRVLPNGITVAASEDHRAPIVYVALMRGARVVASVVAPSAKLPDAIREEARHLNDAVPRGTLLTDVVGRSIVSQGDDNFQRQAPAFIIVGDVRADDAITRSAAALAGAANLGVRSERVPRTSRGQMLTMRASLPAMESVVDIALLVPALETRDYYRARVLALMLSASRSPMRAVLARDKISGDLRVNVSPAGDSGILHIMAEVPFGNNPERVRTDLQRALRAFASSPDFGDFFATSKQSAVSSLLDDEDAFATRAERISWELRSGAPLSRGALEAIAAMKANDVRALLLRAISPVAAAVVVLSGGETVFSNPLEAHVLPMPISLPPGNGLPAVRRWRARTSEFRLANGMRVELVGMPGARGAYVRGFVRDWYANASFEKPGVADVAAQAIAAPGGRTNARSLATAMDRYALEINFGPTFSASGPRSKLAMLLRALADSLEDSNVDSTQMRSVREQLRADLYTDASDPMARGDQAFARAMDPALERTFLTEQNLPALGLDDVHSFLRMHVSPNQTEIVIAVDAPADEVAREVSEAFAPWRADQRLRSWHIPARSTWQPSTVHLTGDTSTNRWMLGQPLVSSASRDYGNALVLVHALDGDCSQEGQPRDSVSLISDQYRGFLQIELTGSASQIRVAAQHCVAALSRLREHPMASDDIERIKLRMVNDALGAYVDPASVAADALAGEAAGSWLLTDNGAAIFTSLTPQSLERFAREVLRPDRLARVTIGS